MNTVLFDLDGTLLPMDQDLFTEIYLRELSAVGSSIGYEPRKLIETVLAGAEAMASNDGTMTNEERFWELFLAVFGGDPREHSAQFEHFYRNEYIRVAKAVEPTPWAEQVVKLLKGKGYQLVLATNPIFPEVAILERMRWAGVDPRDFSLITSYERCRYAKPNLGYYREILSAAGLQPENCLMIGNDVQEDLCAAELGINVFLITDNMINTNCDDISGFPHGSREKLFAYLQKLPARGSERP